MLIAIEKPEKAKKGRTRYRLTYFCRFCHTLFHQYIYARSPSEVKKKLAEKGNLCEKCKAK